MSFEVKGKVEVVYAEQQVTDRFKKREFVIEVQNGMYPEFVKFQLTQERCGLIEPYQKGDEISVSFNLRGRPYNKGSETIYFTNLEAWRVEGGNTATPESHTASTQQPAKQASKPAKSTGGEDVMGMSFSEAGEDELPF